MRTRNFVLLGILACGNAIFAQIVKTDVEIKAEYSQAQKLYEASNFVAAQPMFEELHSMRPDNLVYEERLAMCLLGTRGAGGTAEQDKAARARAMSLLQDAQSKGDSSPLLVTLLEKLGNEEDAPPAAEAPLTPARVDFNQAEKLFSNGDMKGAFTQYQKALEEDPKFYAAALYAGDSLFKLGDCAQAETYYARAVAIDPDTEQGYRYWGDCLMKQGDTAKAEGMYINAVISQPYQKTTRQSLDTWAKAAKKKIEAPAIQLPKRVEPDANGQTNLVFNVNMTGPAGAAWMSYQIAPTVWQKGLFAKTYPNEKKYRHSLAEETMALQVALKAAKGAKGDLNSDPTLKMLADLDRNGMLECWILLDHADEGIAKDYATYRKDHRELLAKYVQQYDVHKM